MRHLVRKSRVRVIHNLTREIKILREKRGDEKKLAKFQRRAERLHDEVKASKNIKEDEVTKFGILNDKTLYSILNEPSSDATLRVTAKFADLPQLKERIVAFKTKFPDYEQFLGPGRKKLMKQEMKAVKKELKNKDKEKKNAETTNEIVKNDEKKKKKKKESKRQNSDEDNVDSNDEIDVDQEQESDGKDEINERIGKNEDDAEDVDEDDDDSEDVDDNDAEDVDDDDSDDEEVEDEDEDQNQDSEEDSEFAEKADSEADDDNVLKKEEIESTEEETDRSEDDDENSDDFQTRKKKPKSKNTKTSLSKNLLNSKTGDKKLKKSNKIVKQSQKEKEEKQPKSKKPEIIREIHPISKEARVKRFSELLKEEEKEEETRKSSKKIKMDTKLEKLGLKIEEDSFFMTADGDRTYMSVAIQKKPIDNSNNYEDDNLHIGKKFSRNKNESFFSNLPNAEGCSDKFRGKKMDRQNADHKFLPNKNNRNETRFDGERNKMKNTGKFDKKFEKKNATSEEHLHPSWAAKKKQQDALKIEFQGKKIVFDD